ncbi:MULTISPECIES: flagellar motor protein MotB [unclassified Salinivibrio]|uniref:flagellar motor protein MotB n=1 Tax=unclassified Salinivibrio TaxID=2636825 RepID=UPI000614862A|nr:MULTISPECIES: flagellar motor protein MotB [unclassified Salinivibrio]KKA46314.1 flagellar motor protein MotB [Salinivibrio sp. KP-1]MPS31782.1 flagellar motor protein MotB [Salinivibrio sp. VYel7]MPX91574.1 flagellar motor protein MotB [Salinivibrio sp. VYel1]MPX93176.1 flagellar motor protein MotB [Salinivibrio sp. VYel9]MPX95997.1 flagellar motor protein MotB [Salinivibrio sp. VYel6]
MAQQQEEEECKCPPPGLPPWMGTFADLMSLLMCFFVLLLSFSEMDVLKFKQIAGSMKFAFGVQNVLEVKDIPKGTSVIAQEFRPGRPEPTPIEVIMQQTIDMTQRTLDFQEGEDDRSGGSQRNTSDKEGGTSAQVASQLEQQRMQQQLEQLQKALMQALQREIDEGAVEVENLGQQLVIRIREKGAFPQNSAFLQPKFRPMVRQIAQLVKDVPGEIKVSGHTDSTPLESELYRSNWDLSAQRAVSVAQEMEKVPGFNHLRMKVEGLADTKPRAPNNSPENRASNRRVEIAVIQGKPTYSDEISTENAAPNAP